MVRCVLRILFSELQLTVCSSLWSQQGSVEAVVLSVKANQDSRPAVHRLPILYTPDEVVRSAHAWVALSSTSFDGRTAKILFLRYSSCFFMCPALFGAQRPLSKGEAKVVQESELPAEDVSYPEPAPPVVTGQH